MWESKCLCCILLCLWRFTTCCEETFLMELEDAETPERILKYQ